MTQEEFDLIFDTLYYGCVQPADNGDKIYIARSKTYWFHYQHVQAGIFERAVLRYLSTATDGPFFPALGELTSLSGEIAAQEREAAERRELARLKEEFPEAEQTAAELQAELEVVRQTMNAKRPTE